MPQARIPRYYIRAFKGEDISAKLYTYFRKIVLVNVPLQQNETKFEPLQKDFDK